MQTNFSNFLLLVIFKLALELVHDLIIYLCIIFFIDIQYIFKNIKRNSFYLRITPLKSILTWPLIQLYASYYVSFIKLLDNYFIY